MSTAAARIRTAGAEDLSIVLGLWAGARSADAVSEDRPQDLARLLARSPGALLLAEIDDRLVGFEDRRAGAFWDSVGYPQDPDIGRRVRTLPGDGRA